MSSPIPRVVVLGAGVAGLEALFLLESRLSGRVDLELVYQDADFVLRPNLVYVPFGADLAASRLSVTDALARKAIPHSRVAVEGIDADLGRLHLAGGRELPYEHLVIATGAASRAHEIPGLEEHAVSVADPAGALALLERFTHMRGRARASETQRVLFVIPRHNQWSAPLYEVALMLDTWLRREHAREPVELCFVTHESSFVEAAGPRMHGLIEHEFAERGIEGRASEALSEVRPGEASFAEGTVEPFDLLVTAPPHAGRVRYDGLPVDERGFLRVQMATRQVVGHPEIYAAGDAADFPLKDAFLALLEADAAADHIASLVGGGRFKRAFEPASTQIIDMLDRAAFAQLPLELTDDPDHPLRLRASEDDEYEIGVSPLWRTGKHMLSSYLLMRFAAAEPFQAGAGWRLLDLGMRAIAAMLAESSPTSAPRRSTTSAAV